MKNQASSLDLVHLVHEFQDLVGGKINKIYRDANLLFFTVYSKGNRVNWLLDIPDIAYISNEKPNFPAKPDGFCMFLRRRLINARIDSIAQTGFDRVLHIKLTKDEEYNIFVEFFGKGNFIVCDKDNKIISLLDSVVFSDRAIRGGVIYQPPQPHAFPTNMSFVDFDAQFKDVDPVIALAKNLGLGGEYAEMVLERANVAKDAQNPNKKKLFIEVKKLFDYKPQEKDGLLFPFDVKGKEVASLSEEIAKRRDPTREEKKKAASTKEKKKAETKVAKILKAQEKKLVQFEKDSVQYQRMGEAVYENYQQLKELIKHIRDDRKSLSEKKLKEKYEGLDYVHSITRTKVVLDLPEEK